MHGGVRGSAGLPAASFPGIRRSHPGTHLSAASLRMVSTSQFSKACPSTPMSLANASSCLRTCVQRHYERNT